MTGSEASTVGARVRPGLWAGGTVGLLTAMCYLLLFGGLDFSRGNPIASLVTLPRSMLALGAVLVLAGSVAGALISLRTSHE